MYTDFLLIFFKNLKIQKSENPKAQSLFTKKHNRFLPKSTIAFYQKAQWTYPLLLL
jgi:hypothetical protein